MPEVWFPNLGIEIEKLNSVIFDLGGFEIHYYGLILALAVLSGYLTAIFEAKRTNQNVDYYSDFYTIAIITSIIGARLYYVVFNFSIYKDNFWQIFNLRSGGIAIYGAVIFAVITAVVFCKKKNLDMYNFMDTLAPGLILGQAIGRWGNFFNKEVFGNYTDSLFAMRYMVNQVNSQFVTGEIAKNIVTVSNVSYIQVHPTFLYESVCNFLIFITLVALNKKKKFQGQVLICYFILYGAVRFVIEGIRADQLKISQTDIPISQVVSIVLIVASAFMWKYLSNKTAVINEDGSHTEDNSQTEDDSQTEDNFQAGEDSQTEDNSQAGEDSHTEEDS